MSLSSKEPNLLENLETYRLLESPLKVLRESEEKQRPTRPEGEWKQSAEALRWHPVRIASAEPGRYSTIRSGSIHARASQIGAYSKRLSFTEIVPVL